jgi:3-hydroxyacyl-CoA dehydrogenase
LTSGDVSSTLSRVAVANTIKDAVLNVNLVIEAIHEDIEAKKQVFAEVSPPPLASK